MTTERFERSASRILLLESRALPLRHAAAESKFHSLIL